MLKGIEFPTYQPEIQQHQGHILAEVFLSGLPYLQVDMVEHMEVQDNTCPHSYLLSHINMCQRLVLCCAGALLGGLLGLFALLK